MKNLFMDFETDGLNTELCQVTQIAVIDENGKTLYCKGFGVELNKYQPAEISQQGLNYNNHPDEYRDYLPVFSTQAFIDLQQLLRMADNVWAHNSPFDSAVYNTLGQRALGEAFSGLTTWQCTMKLACEKFGKKGQTRMKLPQLLMESVAHDALDDARNCWLLWQKCNGLGRWAEGTNINLAAFGAGYSRV